MARVKLRCIMGCSGLKRSYWEKCLLAHFTAIHGEPFKIYQNIANFEKQIHNVNLGQSYLTDTSCQEMLFYLSKSIVLENITKSLNVGTIRYYRVHNDGSNSAKTMDEKELFIMKTAHKGEVKFHVMSLKEPDEANEEGLKAALEPSLMKLRVNIKRKNREKCTLIRGCSCTFVPSAIVPRGMYTYFHE